MGRSNLHNNNHHHHHKNNNNNNNRHAHQKHKQQRNHQGKINSKRPAANNENDQQRQQQQKPRFKAKGHAKVHKANNPNFPFDRHRLQPKWTMIRRVGPGLVNGINTCFLNSVLQCLTYTAPFAQQLLSENHRSTCSLPGFCALCAMETHIHRVFEPNGKKSAIFPKNFTSNIQAISKTLKPRHQEDAHEFLMFLFASLQKSLLYGIDSPPSNAQELTMLHGIFGGRLQSQLRCHSCNHNSNSFEPLLNLTIGVHKANTLEHALKKFFCVEKIGFDDPDNKYNCSACKQKVCARKQLTINELPMMLPVHLNRFAFDFQSGFSGKVTRYIKYPEHLNMAPYISPEEKTNAKNISSSYHLYAVLVHIGNSCHSGHYFAYIKNSDGKWYRMDDDLVTPVTIAEVLRQKAYILFYANDASAPVSKKTPETKQEPAAPAPAPAAAPVVCAPKRKREEEEAEEKAERKRVCEDDDDDGFVQGASESVISNRPEAWFVRPAHLPYRSLRGSLLIKKTG